MVFQPLKFGFPKHKNEWCLRSRRKNGHVLQRLQDWRVSKQLLSVHLQEMANLFFVGMMKLLVTSIAISFTRDGQESVSNPHLLHNKIILSAGHSKMKTLRQFYLSYFDQKMWRARNGSFGSTTTKFRGKVFSSHCWDQWADRLMRQ